MRHQSGQLGRMDRKRLAVVGAVCFVLLALALRAYMGGGSEEKKKVAHGRPLVKVVTVARADMMRHIALSGQTVADADIPLAPKYTGRITEVRAKLGDEVQAGDVLMVQDTGDLDISIEANAAAAGAAQADAREARALYDANYLKARNDLELEQSKYERNEYLYSIGAISQDTLDKVKQEYLASSAASVESKAYTAEKAQHATDALRRQREDMYLRAPRAGVIGYRNAETGAIVSAGTKVFSLVDTSHINIDCTIAEADAAILKAGLPVEVTIDALGEDYAGEIVYVSPAMDEASKTYQVRIELTDEAARETIKAGLFAHTAVDILQRRATLCVPKEALLSRTGRQVLFVVREDGTVEERAVKVGLMNDAEVEILDGLEPGDTVVVTNQDKLQDGKKVETEPYEGEDSSDDEASAS
ncbi:efflux RND transporter periplasmic adaptor subunit [Mitsuokella jalaludinii]|uniref:efflux RND transporter periplasmic adaptor subunit n=1 Tax=Mitsuokella jalaludinii TaxID=187979 RepID=UPI00307CCE84